MDKYVHFIYRISKKFPKDEIYNLTSQIKRATLSIVLNYIEGYARNRQLVRLNFLETSFGSLKESKYLLYFSLVEKFTDKDEYCTGLKLAEEISAMLWTEINHLEKSINK